MDSVPTEGAQMYASYVQVHFNSGKKGAAIQLLNDEIIPQVKQAPGFVRGIWVGNDELGHGVVVFEAREQAAQVTQAIESVADVYNVVATDVYEVHGEA
jgi:nitrate reductase NapAB chaperone NapD